MTRKIIIFNAFFLILSGWVSACARASAPVYADLHRPIIVNPMTPTITVRLVANPTTGYQWVLVKYDADCMETPSSHALPPDNKLIGAPGYTVWQFKFKKAAFVASRKTVVVLEYKRPWETLAGKQQVIHFEWKAGEC